MERLASLGDAEVHGVAGTSQVDCVQMEAGDQAKLMPHPRART